MIESREFLKPNFHGVQHMTRLLSFIAAAALLATPVVNHRAIMAATYAKGKRNRIKGLSFWLLARSYVGLRSTKAVIAVSHAA
jgi:hypothetical protein